MARPPSPAASNPGMSQRPGPILSAPIRAITALLVALLAAAPARADAPATMAAPPAIAATPPATAAAPPAANDTTRTRPGEVPATVKASPPVPHLFTRGDLLFWGGAVGATALAVFNDRWLTNEAIKAENNPDQRHLAQAFQPLGNTAIVLPVAFGLYGVARLIHHPKLARRSIRTALSVTVSGGLALGAKEVFGRARPYERPGQSDYFKPFSHHDSFPSGHATTAFAAAVALDRETSGRWVPWLVYPAATLVGWSRVHDRKHWTSDVVAGAALGGWTAWKTEDFLAYRALGVPVQRTSLWLSPERGGVRVAVVRALN
jgi:membrane-associated phospholipid phosphatase